MTAPISAATGWQEATWLRWNTVQATSATTTAYTGNELIWAGWNQDLTTTFTNVTTAARDVTTGLSVWAAWNLTSMSTTLTYTTVGLAAETPEMAQRRLQRQEAGRRAAQARMQAEQVARRLLLEHLDARQRLDVRMHGYFEVLSDAGRRWRIRTDRGYAGNVEFLDAEGRVQGQFCCHVASSCSLPVSDHLLAQKLALQTSEQGFLAVANLSAGRRPAITEERRAVA